MKNGNVREALSLMCIVALLLFNGLIGCDDNVWQGDGDVDSGGDGDADGDVDSDADSDDAPPLTDSDGDSITDSHEGSGSTDTDGDGTPDSLDDDSDGDGFSDAAEAGDDDLVTLPVDTDGDGAPDYRDLDSDGDGLPDSSEASRGTDRTNADSDGDGVSDLVEVVAETDPLDPSSNPRERGDFFFLVPYEETPDPARDTLIFATDIQQADVHFMIDTSISMQSYIDRIRESLRTAIIPGITESIPDVQLGLGEFDLCPSSTHMPGICRGIEMAQTSTDDVSAVEAALDSLTADCRPVHEPYAQAAWVWATGDTARWPRMAARDCPAGAVGYGCVREGALPILLVIGDEPFSESYATRYESSCGGGACDSCATFPREAEIIDAFAAIRGRLMVLGGTGESSEWAPIVTATGAVNARGGPLIFPSAGTADVDRQVVNAISTLASSTPLDMTAVARDVDDDGVDATVFIERIEPNTTGGIADPRDPTVICVGDLSTRDSDDDGFPDTFTGITPGTPVCFDIIARENTTVPSSDAPQLFRAEVDVIGDGITVLDTREVFFLVPPREDSPIF